MEIQPYVFFEGRANEAIEFYKKALGAEVAMLTRFKESPDQSMITPGSEDKIMHCELRIGTQSILLSDGQCSGQGAFQGFSLSVTVDSIEEADKIFNAVADGGQVQLPLTETFFSKRFGMTMDKFGVAWMVYLKPSAN
jgi:PhnB protein